MNRRGFLLGAASLLAAPSIVRASTLMPVSVAVSEAYWVREGTTLLGCLDGEPVVSFGRRATATTGTTWTLYRDGKPLWFDRLRPGENLWELMQRARGYPSR